jgi:hypothetical protein
VGLGHGETQPLGTENLILSGALRRSFRRKFQSIFEKFASSFAGGIEETLARFPFE